MTFFRMCPQCKDDLQMDKDDLGFFVECMNCGWYKDVADLRTLFSKDLVKPGSAVVS